jgi:hypothetical protein
VSKIYKVSKLRGDECVHYVRANTLNAALRAVSTMYFVGGAATTEEMYQALAKGNFEVIDAVKAEQLELGGGNE